LQDSAVHPPLTHGHTFLWEDSIPPGTLEHLHCPAALVITSDMEEGSPMIPTADLLDPEKEDALLTQVLRTLHRFPYASACVSGSGAAPRTAG